MGFMEMKEMAFSQEELIQLIQAVAGSGIRSLHLETGDFKLRIDGRGQESAASPGAPAPRAPIQQEPALPAEAPVKGTVVKSPIVGTYYSSPSPDSPPFAAVGKKVNKGDVLFIIESMKLMNEVQSEYEGTVAEILVENGQPVEYGQPILRIV